MDRTALVAYGTETGNALDCAEEVGRALERLHFEAPVQSLDEIDPSCLSTFSFVVFIVSTTGQGDLPANTRGFWKKLLRKKLAADFLANVSFSSFGLGDSSYPQYNWAVRKIHKRVKQLGAIEFSDRGEGDEQHEEGVDGQFIPWIARLRSQVLDRYPLSSGQEPIPEHELLPPKWLLQLKTQTDSETNGVSIQRPYRDTRLDVTVKSNQRMTPTTHWQDVRHIQLTTQQPIHYDPGDVLTIYPQNSKEDVKQIIDLMDWNNVSQSRVALRPTKSKDEGQVMIKHPVEALTTPNMTLQNLIADHLDLNAIPRRSFFSLISHFTNDEFQKQRLEEFAKPEFVDEYFDYATRPRRSILEVLQEFDTVKIPWAWAANALPTLRGRQFSIASGGALKHEGMDTRFDLLVAIVKYKTIIKKVREGVCTKYLAALQDNQTLSVSLQRGSLGLLNAHTSKPIVLIGPGTGVAPIRSILWERAEQATREAAGDHVLIFGCRNESADYFFRSEWELLSKQIPLDVHVAFSRDQKNKVYVQDIVKDQGRNLYRLLHDLKGIVFVCGSSGNMPTAVRATLTDVVREQGAISQTEAESYLGMMDREGRYKQETWG